MIQRRRCLWDDCGMKRVECVGEAQVLVRGRRGIGAGGASESDKVNVHLPHQSNITPSHKRQGAIAE